MRLGCGADLIFFRACGTCGQSGGAISSLSAEGLGGYDGDGGRGLYIRVVVPRDRGRAGGSQAHIIRTYCEDLVVKDCDCFLLASWLKMPTPNCCEFCYSEELTCQLLSTSIQTPEPVMTRESRSWRSNIMEKDKKWQE